jgi:serine/threonine protein kinase
MKDPADRGYFLLCRALGWLLRATRYSKTRIVVEDGERRVRKRRVSYAPLLVRLSGRLMKILDTGVRVLSQRDWEKRERLLYRRLRAASIRIDGTGTLVLPLLAGKTLTALLEDPRSSKPLRERAIALAVLALAELHRRGFTHGDAMADNVIVDLDAGAAQWVDFETVHDSNRSMIWRRADDVRALLSTCLVRTPRAEHASTVRLIIDV